MRPDEHKKKKNATYKKKHGMASKPSNETADTIKEKTVKKNVEKQDRKHHQQQPTQTSKDRDHGLTSSDDSSSDSNEPQQMVPKRNQFNRRQIVSNWQKYELKPDSEDKITTRGEKYETLLNMAGEAMSRFRFQDELEWEADCDQSKEEIVAATDEFHNCLSLNSSDLTQSLSCIPIHHILGVNEDLFQKDQLESILQAASKNHALYHPKETIDRENNHSQALTHKVDNSSTDNKIPPLSPNLKNSRTNKDLQKTTLSPNVTSCISNSEISSSDSFGAIKENNNHENEKLLEPNLTQPYHGLSLQDADLDLLLDMEETESASNSNSSSTVIGGNDSLKINKNDVVSKDKSDDKKETEDLEEWLDGILD